jgi:glutamyl-tRNA reductase
VIIILGVSHKTAPLDVRERIAAATDDPDRILTRLSSTPGIGEVIWLSTCNRVEIVASVKDDAADQVYYFLREELARQAGYSDGEELSQYLYDKRGTDAIHHLFRVASSLDSIILGEPQILGQLKKACDSAARLNTIHGQLGTCLQRAFAVAKRVRSETSIGLGTVSVSSAGVDLARRIFGDLSSCVVLLLGAGEMAESAARSLGHGARALRICNRSMGRATGLAAELHATAVPWEQLEAELVEADIVVASTASPIPVVTREMVRRAGRARRGRTLFFIDIAVPRNVEPAVHGLDNVYVYNVDDLQIEVSRGLRARQGEVEAAERIVQGELDSYVAWTRSLEVQPTIVALRAKVRSILSSELERTLTGRLQHLGSSERAALATMLDSAANKLLHEPSMRLKARAAEHGDAQRLAAAVQLLFDLSPPLLHGETQAEPAELSENTAERPMVSRVR